MDETEIDEAEVDRDDILDVVEDAPEDNEETSALQESIKRNKELEDRIHRNMAEFDNFRKRTAKEKTSIYDDGINDTVSKLLPVIDSFERAISTLDIEDEANKGILMIHKQFETALMNIGVETIDCVGETFDHNLHFAVSHASDESLGIGEIVEEMQKGYKYKDKVIRCSMVKVVN